MATQEISEQEYSAIKADLNEGLTNDQAAAKYHFGLRRVRLVRRSKSYASYKALRRNEAKKRLENTPAKPQGGGSELENTDVTDLMIEPDDKPAVEPTPAPEPAQPKTKAELKREKDAQDATFFYTAIAVLVFIGVLLGLFLAWVF